MSADAQLLCVLHTLMLKCASTRGHAHTSLNQSGMHRGVCLCANTLHKHLEGESMLVCVLALQSSHLSHLLLIEPAMYQSIVSLPSSTSFLSSGTERLSLRFQLTGAKRYNWPIKKWPRRTEERADVALPKVRAITVLYA